MANTDSFLDEVNEELRRDRLYGLMRRWGWLAILAVVLIVGGAAYFEWQKAQNQAEAEAFGDAVLTALDAEEAAARTEALGAITPPNPEAAMILALLAAGEVANGADAQAAADQLRAAANAPDLPRRYVDLAILKAEMLAPGPEDEARAALQSIAAPGAPYAPLAEEQLALLELRAGNIEAATDRLRSIERSAAATAGLQQRASRLIVAIESGAVLVDQPFAPPVGEQAPEDAALVAAEDGAQVEDEVVADEAPLAETLPEAGAADGASAEQVPAAGQ